jgi:hypothetical protein
MFVILLLLLIAAGALHARFTGPRTSRRTAECILVYVLAGYCGLAQVLVGVGALASPDFAAHMSRVSNVGEVLPWFASMYVGAAIAAVLAIRLRGDYVIAPVIIWAVFFAGATWAHMHTEALHGRAPGLHGSLWIFASHGLVSVTLLVAWWLSRGRDPRPA